MSFDHVSPPEMLLRQHLDIFSALQKRDGDAVERAMTQHLQEISESVRQIRQKTATGLAKSNSFTLIPSGMRGFSPPYGSCMHQKDVSLIKNKKYFTRQEYLYCARYVGFDCKSERRKHL